MAEKGPLIIPEEYSGARTSQEDQVVRDPGNGSSGQFRDPGMAGRYQETLVDRWDATGRPELDRHNALTKKLDEISGTAYDNMSKIEGEVKQLEAELQKAEETGDEAKYKELEIRHQEALREYRKEGKAFQRAETGVIYASRISAKGSELLDKVNPWTEEKVTARQEAREQKTLAKEERAQQRAEQREAKLKAQEERWQAFTQKIDSIRGKVGETVSAVAGKVGETAGVVAGKAGEVIDRTKETIGAGVATVQEIGQGVVGAGKLVTERVGEYAKGAKEGTSEIFETARNNVSAGITKFKIEQMGRNKEAMESVLKELADAQTERDSLAGEIATIDGELTNEKDKFRRRGLEVSKAELEEDIVNLDQIIENLSNRNGSQDEISQRISELEGQITTAKESAPEGGESAFLLIKGKIKNRADRIKQSGAGLIGGAKEGLSRLVERIKERQERKLEEKEAQHSAENQDQTEGQTKERFGWLKGLAKRKEKITRFLTRTALPTLLIGAYFIGGRLAIEKQVEDAQGGNPDITQTAPAPEGDLRTPEGGENQEKSPFEERFPLEMEKARQGGDQARINHLNNIKQAREQWEANPDKDSLTGYGRERASAGLDGIKDVEAVAKKLVEVAKAGDQAGIEDVKHTLDRHDGPKLTDETIQSVMEKDLSDDEKTQMLASILTESAKLLASAQQI